MVYEAQLALKCLFTPTSF